MPRAASSRRTFDGSGADGQLPALRHGVHGIEDEIDQGLADFAFDARDRRQILAQLRPQFNHDSALLRHVGPTRARQVDDLLHQHAQIHRREDQFRLLLAIELAHARDGMRHVPDGALGGLQVFARAFAETRFLFQQHFRVQLDGRNGVVDVVRDSARHLPQRAQPFLLHHGLLGLAQVVIGLLQGAVGFAFDGPPARRVR